MGDEVKGSSSVRVEQIKTEVLVKIEGGSEGAAFLESSEETDLKCDVRETGLLLTYPPEEVDESEASLKREAGDEEFITGDLDQSDDDDVPPHPLPKQAQTPKMKSADLDSSPRARNKYKCVDCPFSSDNSACFKSHLTLHKKGSRSLICKECNWHVHPTKMAIHIKNRHAPKESPTANGSRMLEDTSNPHFVTYYTAHNRKTIFKCRRCPFQCKDSKSIKKHGEVHKKGSDSAICKQCGVHVFSRRMAKHPYSCPKRSVSESRTSVPVPVIINCKISR